MFFFMGLWETRNLLLLFASCFFFRAKYHTAWLALTHTRARSFSRNDSSRSHPHISDIDHCRSKYFGMAVEFCVGLLYLRRNPRTAKGESGHGRWQSVCLVRVYHFFSFLPLLPAPADRYGNFFASSTRSGDHEI